MTNDVPNPPRRNSQITASWLSNLVNSVKRRTPIAGNGIRISQTPNGAVISCTNTGAKAASTGEDSAYWALSVTPSIVNEETIYTCSCLVDSAALTCDTLTIGDGITFTDRNSTTGIVNISIPEDVSSFAAYLHAQIYVPTDWEDIEVTACINTTASSPYKPLNANNPDNYEYYDAPIGSFSVTNDIPAVQSQVLTKAVDLAWSFPFASLEGNAFPMAATGDMGSISVPSDPFNRVYGTGLAEASWTRGSSFTNASGAIEPPQGVCIPVVTDYSVIPTGELGAGIYLNTRTLSFDAEGRLMNVSPVKYTFGVYDFGVYDF